MWVPSSSVCVVPMRVLRNATDHMIPKYRSVRFTCTGCSSSGSAALKHSIRWWRHILTAPSNSFSHQCSLSCTAEQGSAGMTSCTTSFLFGWQVQLQCRAAPTRAVHYTGTVGTTPVAVQNFFAKSNRPHIHGFYSWSSFSCCFDAFFCRQPKMKLSLHLDKALKPATLQNKSMSSMKRATKHWLAGAACIHWQGPFKKETLL